MVSTPIRISAKEIIELSGIDVCSCFEYQNKVVLEQIKQLEVVSFIDAVSE